MESFAQQVRDELTRSELNCKDCLKAELAAVVHISGTIHLGGKEKLALSLVTEAAGVARRFIKLIKAAYNLDSEIRMEEVSKLGKLHRYSIMIPAQENLNEMLDELGMLSRERQLDSSIRPALVKNKCCKAAFLRGAFLAGGSITDPQKTYHLEIVTCNEEFAAGLVYLMSLLGIKAKIVQRKQRYLVYLKDSEVIGRFLSMVSASHAVIKLEEIRVIKGMRGEVNRQVNCETANIEKTLSAAWQQVELIQQLITIDGLNSLTPNLRKTAELRLEYPEASLKELGDNHLPPLSKSAVNHRLRLICQHAKNLTDSAGKKLTKPE